MAILTPAHSPLLVLLLKLGTHILANPQIFEIFVAAAASSVLPADAAAHSFVAEAASFSSCTANHTLEHHFALTKLTSAHVVFR